MNLVPAGDKTAVANPVSGGYKTGGVNLVPTGDKTAAANPVSGEYKTDCVNLVPTGDKTGSAQIAMSVGHKNAAADGDESAVSTGYKNVAANADDNASPASAVRMDAFTGTAWTAFAATGRSVMVFFAAGRDTFAVARCFWMLLSAIRCAGCGYAVMNSFFVCRDGFIFPGLSFPFFL